MKVPVRLKNSVAVFGSYCTFFAHDCQSSEEVDFVSRKLIKLSLVLTTPIRYNYLRVNNIRTLFAKDSQEKKMINNDILRRIRYALNINDAAMIELFRLSGYEIAQPYLSDLLKKEDEPGYVECSDEVMEFFLDGLILQKRGPKEMKPGQTSESARLLNNNLIFKKLRIALELKEEDIVGILKLAGIYISKAELTALFRKEGHKNYQECGDQFLRNFLKGLTLYCRRTAVK